MGEFDEEEIDAPAGSFFRRNRIALGIGTLLIALAIFGIVKLSANNGSSSRRDPITIVSLPPPPPPPPAPKFTPPPEPPPEQRIEQPMIKEDQPKEAEAKPKDEPALGTNIKGDGSSDGFGLSGSGNGRLGGTGTRGGTKWASYAGQVQARIEEALRRNRRTRSASLSVNVRVWPDASGRIARAQLAGTTGDTALDATLRDEVLTGLQLAQPPPADMPSPIVLRLAARRP